MLVLDNDEKTRSFLCMDLPDHTGLLTKLTRCSDEILSLFRQPTFYKVGTNESSGF